MILALLFVATGQLLNTAQGAATAHVPVLLFKLSYCVFPSPAQAATSAFDVGSWEAYGDHWRYFFDCMLAPVATQAQSALDKLPATATPRASLDTPTNFLSAVMTSWSAMVADITRGGKGTAAAAYQPQTRNLFAYALAPQHGPVVRTCLSRLVKEYNKWTQEQVR